ncbi:amidase family protein [Shouchella clausii]|jgi:amidase|uniref:Amidase n=2 Tax=Bacillaceae TaxID=186817 RepID=A0A268RYG9_SHOCL|nr:amidase family protein [Shouchella clausii]PAD43061.1 amidase [Bacillus sp. 7520-S]AST97140.1 amidase [Shouchella clausii]MEB5473835.1 amidase family protein [Shouchella clausii]PAD15709.1 amidase [Shouchella clausii]PAE97870.1 amidase [Shouchella clausii]
MDSSDYKRLDGVALAELIQAGNVSPEEVLDAHFQVSYEWEKLNAIVSKREKEVYQEAKETAKNGVFSGVPFLLKDSSHALKGAQLTSGSALFKQERAKVTSHYTRTLQQAGLLMAGHTNAPEFGLKNITEPKLHGPARNPLDLDYSPGGSSGGAAAAVASGIVPLAGASDGGGSIRIPASFTGLVGLKPTRGRTPVGPGVGRQWQGAAIDFVLSRSVRDSARALDVLQTVQWEAAFQTPLFANRYEHTLQERLPRLRTAFSAQSPVGTPVSQEAITALQQAVDWLEKAGHHVEEAAPPIDGVELMRHYYLMNAGEMSRLRQQLGQALGRCLNEDDFEMESWVLAEYGDNVRAAEYAASLAAWDDAAAATHLFHETYDLYLTPATASVAPRIGELTPAPAQERSLKALVQELPPKEQLDLVYEMFLPSLTYTPFTQLANLTGQPAISMPLFKNETGLAIGVQAMARKGEEHRLLQLAYAFEQSELWQVTQPQ